MTRARFILTEGNFDGVLRASLTIDRSTRIVTIRPYRCRRTFSMMLDELAEIAISRTAPNATPCARPSTSRWIQPELFPEAPK